MPPVVLRCHNEVLDGAQQDQDVQIYLRISSTSSLLNPSRWRCLDFIWAASFAALILHCCSSGMSAKLILSQIKSIFILLASMSTLWPASSSIFLMFLPVVLLQLSMVNYGSKENLTAALLPFTMELAKLRNLLMRRIFRCLHSVRCSKKYLCVSWGSCQTNLRWTFQLTSSRLAHSPYKFQVLLP